MFFVFANTAPRRRNSRNSPQQSSAENRSSKSEDSNDDSLDHSRFVALSPTSPHAAVQYKSSGFEARNDKTLDLHHTLSTSLGGGILLATALIRVKGPYGLEITVRALIDSCSQVSLISES